jgi:5-methylcytosine-specific restriction endonuclease McrA
MARPCGPLGGEDNDPDVIPLRMNPDDRSIVARRAKALQNKLRRLREKRRRAVRKRRASAHERRGSLTPKQRQVVLAKTDGRCHICGGRVENRWQADHVNPHAHGGSHSEDNYLATHPVCNNYKWHYLPEEFQYVMKIGVWARQQIEKDTPVGREIAERFCAHERRREGRRVRGV